MEHNKQPSEIKSFSEEQKVKEQIAITTDNKTAKEIARDKEYGEGEESSVKTTKKENRQEENNPNQQNGSGGTSAGGAGGAAGAAGAGAVAVVAVVAITAAGIFGNTTAKFDKIEPAGSYVDYSLNVAFDFTPEDKEAVVNFEELDTGLTLVIYNNSHRETVSLDTGELESEVKSKLNGSKYEVEVDFKGRLKSLTPKNTYKLEVIGEDNGNIKKHVTKSFKTTGPMSYFEDIVYNCQCSVDGYFYYDINYVDDAGYYSDFTYTMVSKDLKKPMILNGDIKDPTQRQKIDVSSLKGQKYTLTITYNTSDTDDNSGGVVTISQDYDVEI